MASQENEVSANKEIFRQYSIITIANDGVWVKQIFLAGTKEQIERRTFAWMQGRDCLVCELLEEIEGRRTITQQMIIGSEWGPKSEMKFITNLTLFKNGIVESAA